MADKKFKNGVDLQSTIKISSETSERAMVLNASGELVSSNVTDTELGYMSGVTSDIQTQVDAKADLVGGKIPSSQIPAVAIVEVFTAADIAARDALTIGSGDGEIQEGDVVIVTDASDDAAITAGAASYIYDGSAYKLLKAGDEVLSVNGEVGTVVLDTDDISEGVNKYVSAAQKLLIDSALQSGDNVSELVNDAGYLTSAPAAPVDSVNGETGVVVLDADDISDAATTNKYTNAADISKLAGIESGATADQSDAEIKTAYENNADTNAFTDAEQSKLSGIEALATADQTGAEIKIAYEAEADTNAFDDAAVSKLGGIEALADVTDATNVAAAGATMDSDSSLAGNSYFLDEDDMNSDDATKVPSQQSVKAYVDSQVGGVGSAGDISETSFAAANNQAAAANVTGLAFANGVVRSFKALVSVEIDATADLYESYELMGIQKGSGWDMSIESVGDESNIVFSITSAGQVQYTSANEAGFVSNSIKFRADTTSV